MLQSAERKGFRSYFIVHRRELVKQASRTFSEAGVEHGVIAAGFPQDPARLVQIGSVQSLARQRDQLVHPHFAIWDEAHHLPAPGWAALQDKFAGAFHIGLSATPIRLDGKGVGDHFDTMVSGPSIAWLQRRGYLAVCHHYAPASLDVSGVRIRMGDFVRSELAAAVGRSFVNIDAVEAYGKLAPGKRAIIFAASIEQSEAAVTAFRSAGIAAEHVDGKTQPNDRDAALARFEAGATTVLSNVDLFGEGFDLPALECVIMLRPTWSLGLYLQMLGRALRPAPAKPHAIAIDLVGNWKRHGLVDENRLWSLSPPPPATDTSRSDLKPCRACSAVSRATASFCPACDAPQRPRRSNDLAAWEDLVREPGLARWLRTQPLSRAITWAESEHQLRQVALARGFKPGWAFHRWREREAARVQT